MPPYKRPNSLQSTALKKVADMVLTACTIIEEIYGNTNEEICRIKLEVIQKFLLSKIQPLFDELYEAATFHHTLEQTRNDGNESTKWGACQLVDGRIFFSVMICDHLKKLTIKRFVQESCFFKCLDDNRFWKSQISKLSRIVVLNISEIKLSDEIFVEISRTCRDLKEICFSSDLHHASKHSVLNLLACKELQRVKIVFLNWHHKNEIVNFIRAFVRNLPKLCFFDFDEMGTVLSQEATINSLIKINEICITHESLVNIINVSPRLQDLNIGARFNSISENYKILTTLAESSLRIKALGLDRFLFDDAMVRLLTMKGSHLEELKLGVNSGVITVDEIYLLGFQCPNLETLEVVEYYHIISPTLSKTQSCTILPRETKHRLFVRLKRLTLNGNSKWDQRILPLLLSDANELEDIRLTNVFAHTTDMSEIFSVNSLGGKLENFAVVAERYGHEVLTATISRKLICRLVDCCSKLKKLAMSCRFEDGALLYLKELRNKIKQQNLDLEINVNEIKYLANSCSIRNAFGGYILYDE